jgi:hypothetical protein
MSSAVCSCASKCVRPGAVARGSYTVCADLSLEAGASCCERLCGYIFVNVYSLGMLA